MLGKKKLNRNYTVSLWKEEIYGAAAVDDMKQKFKKTTSALKWKRCDGNEAFKFVACFVVLFWSHHDIICLAVRRLAAVSWSFSLHLCWTADMYLLLLWCFWVTQLNICHFIWNHYVFMWLFRFIHNDFIFNLYVTDQTWLKAGLFFFFSFFFISFIYIETWQSYLHSLASCLHLGLNWKCLVAKTDVLKKRMQTKQSFEWWDLFGFQTCQLQSSSVRSELESQVLALWRTLFPAYAVTVHSAWDWPEAKTMTPTSVCAVKKFCQRPFDNYCQSKKKESIRNIFWKTMCPRERTSNRNSLFFQFNKFCQDFHYWRVWRRQ